MTSFFIYTDADSITVDAVSFDAAAKIYDPSVSSADELIAKVEADGGTITIRDESTMESVGT
jgi:transposase